ncbi:MAG: Na+/H+ antiporter subunit G [Chlorobi bacterium]|nr:Na+/H+ antiporter subunit G [Chlorobiota bacterium]
MKILDITGAILTLIGSIFIFLGALGVLRMPDVYNRIQTGTKASTLGTMLTLTGIGMIHPGWFGKIAILIIFIAITNPVSSHVLARAAHFINIPLTSKTVVDKLRESKIEEMENALKLEEEQKNDF